MSRKRKHPDQLDLFDRPACLVHALPAAVWGGTVWRDKVQCIAQAIAAATDPVKRDRYLPGACELLERDLQKLGASDPETLSELARYRAAVYLELGRLRSPIRSGPGAA